jgi:hypothetical protein
MRGEVMGKEGKIKEMEPLISIEGEKGFLPFGDASELPSNDIVSSDQIDDVLMMFDEMDIDVMEDLHGLKGEEEKVLDKEEEEGEGVRIRGARKGDGSCADVSPVEKAENEIRKIEGKSRTAVSEARAFLKKLNVDGLVKSHAASFNKILLSMPKELFTLSTKIVITLKNRSLKT